MQITAVALGTLFLLASHAESLATPAKVGQKGAAFFKGGDRAYVTRDIKTPDPVPEEGQELAVELMKTGRLYRYNINPGEESVVSQCELDVIAYTGHKYCIALNSCGSALMLLLKTTDLPPGGKVISNAFTFGAVPSAIEHAGGRVSLSNVDSDHPQLQILNRSNCLL